MATREVSLVIRAVNAADGALKEAEAGLRRLGLSAQTAGHQAGVAGAGGFSSLQRNIVTLNQAAELAGRVWHGFVEPVVQAGTEALNLSRRLSIPIEDLGTLGFAAAQADVPLESLGFAFKTMAGTIAESQRPNSEAAANLRALGFTAKEAGTLVNLDAGQQLLAFIDKLRLFQDSANKTALATKAFGRSGLDIIQLSKEPKAAIEASIEVAKRYNLAWSQESGEAADRVDDAIKRIGAAFTGLYKHLADTGALDRLGAAIEGIADAIAGRGLAQAAADAGAALASFLETFGPTAVEATGEAVRVFTVAVNELNDALRDFSFDKLARLFLKDTVVDALTHPAQTLGNAALAVTTGSVGRSLPPPFGVAPVAGPSALEEEVVAREALARRVASANIALTEGLSLPRAATGGPLLPGRLTLAEGEGVLRTPTRDFLGAIPPTPRRADVDRLGQRPAPPPADASAGARVAELTKKLATLRAEVADDTANLSPFEREIAKTARSFETLAPQAEKSVRALAEMKIVQKLDDDTAKFRGELEALRDPTVARAQEIAALARSYGLLAQNETIAALAARDPQLAQKITLDIDSRHAVEAERAVKELHDQLADLADPLAADARLMDEAHRKAVLLGDTRIEGLTQQLVDMKRSLVDVVHLTPLLKDGLGQVADGLIAGTQKFKIGDVLRSTSVAFGKQFFGAILDDKLKDFDPKIHANFARDIPGFAKEGGGIIAKLWGTLFGTTLPDATAKGAAAIATAQRDIPAATQDAANACLASWDQSTAAVQEAHAQTAQVAVDAAQRMGDAADTARSPWLSLFDAIWGAGKSAFGGLIGLAEGFLNLLGVTGSGGILGGIASLFSSAPPSQNASAGSQILSGAQTASSAVQTVNTGARLATGSGLGSLFDGTRLEGAVSGITRIVSTLAPVLGLLGGAYGAINGGSPITRTLSGLVAAKSGLSLLGGGILSGAGTGGSTAVTFGGTTLGTFGASSPSFVGPGLAAGNAAPTSSNIIIDLLSKVLRPVVSTIVQTVAPNAGTTVAQLAPGVASKAGSLASAAALPLAIVGALYSIATAVKGIVDSTQTLQKVERGDAAVGRFTALSGAGLAAGIVGGAAVGAAVGSVVPVLGTAIGAAVGAAAGAAWSSATSSAVAGAIGKGVNQATREGLSQRGLRDAIVEHQGPFLKSQSLLASGFIPGADQFVSKLFAGFLAPNIEHIFNKIFTQATTHAGTPISVGQTQVGDFGRPVSAAKREATLAQFGAGGPLRQAGRDTAALTAGLIGAGTDNAERTQRFFAAIANTLGSARKGADGVEASLQGLVRGLTGSLLSGLREVTGLFERLKGGADATARTRREVTLIVDSFAKFAPPDTATLVAATQRPTGGVDVRKVLPALDEAVLSRVTATAPLTKQQTTKIGDPFLEQVRRLADATKGAVDVIATAREVARTAVDSGGRAQTGGIRTRELTRAVAFEQSIPNLSVDLAVAGATDIEATRQGHGRRKRATQEFAAEAAIATDLTTRRADLTAVQQGTAPDARTAGHAADAATRQVASLTQQLDDLHSVRGPKKRDDAIRAIQDTDQQLEASVKSWGDAVLAVLSNLRDASRALAESVIADREQIATLRQSPDGLREAAAASKTLAFGYAYQAATASTAAGKLASVNDAITFLSRATDDLNKADTVSAALRHATAQTRQTAISDRQEGIGDRREVLAPLAGLAVGVRDQLDQLHLESLKRPRQRATFLQEQIAGQQAIVSRTATTPEATQAKADAVQRLQTLFAGAIHQAEQDFGVGSRQARQARAQATTGLEAIAPQLTAARVEDLALARESRDLQIESRDLQRQMRDLDIRTQTGIDARNADLATTLAPLFARREALQGAVAAGLRADLAKLLPGQDITALIADPMSAQLAIAKLQLDKLDAIKRAVETLANLPRRADGGPVAAHQAVWVGERGVPEVFVPTVAGTIVPASVVRQVERAGEVAPSGMPYRPGVSADGADTWRFHAPAEHVHREALLRAAPDVSRRDRAQSLVSQAPAAFVTADRVVQSPPAHDASSVPSRQVHRVVEQVDVPHRLETVVRHADERHVARIGARLGADEYAVGQRREDRHQTIARDELLEHSRLVLNEHASPSLTSLRREAQRIDVQVHAEHGGRLASRALDVVDRPRTRERIGGILRHDDIHQHGPAAQAAAHDVHRLDAGPIHHTSLTKLVGSLAAGLALTLATLTPSSAAGRAAGPPPAGLVRVGRPMESGVTRLVGTIAAGLALAVIASQASAANPVAPVERLALRHESPAVLKVDTGHAGGERVVHLQALQSATPEQREDKRVQLWGALEHVIRDGEHLVDGRRLGVGQQWQPAGHVARALRVGVDDGLGWHAPHPILLGLGGSAGASVYDRHQIVGRPMESGEFGAENAQRLERSDVGLTFGRAEREAAVLRGAIVEAPATVERHRVGVAIDRRVGDVAGIGRNAVGAPLVVPEPHGLARSGHPAAGIGVHGRVAMRIQHADGDRTHAHARTEEGERDRDQATAYLAHVHPLPPPQARQHAVGGDQIGRSAGAHALPPRIGDAARAEFAAQPFAVFAHRAPAVGPASGTIGHRHEHIRAAEQLRAAVPVAGMGTGDEKHAEQYGRHPLPPAVVERAQVVDHLASVRQAQAAGWHVERDHDVRADSHRALSVVVHPERERGVRANRASLRVAHHLTEQAGDGGADGYGRVLDDHVSVGRHVSRVGATAPFGNDGHPLPPHLARVARTAVDVHAPVLPRLARQAPIPTAEPAEPWIVRGVERPSAFVELRPQHRAAFVVAGEKHRDPHQEQEGRLPSRDLAVQPRAPAVTHVSPPHLAATPRAFAIGRVVGIERRGDARHFGGIIEAQLSAGIPARPLGAQEAANVRRAPLSAGAPMQRDADGLAALAAVPRQMGRDAFVTEQAALVEQHPARRAALSAAIRDRATRDGGAESVVPVQLGLGHASVLPSRRVEQDRQPAPTGVPLDVPRVARGAAGPAAIADRAAVAPRLGMVVDPLQLFQQRERGQLDHRVPLGAVGAMPHDVPSGQRLAHATAARDVRIDGLALGVGRRPVDLGHLSTLPARHVEQLREPAVRRVSAEPGRDGGVVGRVALQAAAAGARASLPVVDPLQRPQERDGVLKPHLATVVDVQADRLVAPFNLGIGREPLAAIPAARANRAVVADEAVGARLVRFGDDEHAARGVSHSLRLAPRAADETRQGAIGGVADLVVGKAIGSARESAAVRTAGARQVSSTIAVPLQLFQDRDSIAPQLSGLAHRVPRGLLGRDLHADVVDRALDVAPVTVRHSFLRAPRGVDEPRPAAVVRVPGLVADLAQRARHHVSHIGSQSATLRTPDAAVGPFVPPQQPAGFVQRGGYAVQVRHAPLPISTSQGTPLPSVHRERFETAMGASFTGVRVYDTPFAHEAAKQLHAHAFAVGRDVFFAAGQYRPGTPQGDRLLAHELTHVQQFQTGRLAGLTGVSRPTDPHERAAAANESVVLGNLASLRTDAPQLPTLAVTSRDRLALPTLSSRTSSAPASTAPTLVTTVTKETNAPITITLHPTINITIAGDAAQGGKDVGLYKRTADGIVASVLTALDSQSVKAKIRKVVS